MRDFLVICGFLWTTLFPIIFNYYRFLIFINITLSWQIHLIVAESVKIRITYIKTKLMWYHYLFSKIESLVFIILEDNWETFSIGSVTRLHCQISHTYLPWVGIRDSTSTFYVTLSDTSLYIRTYNMYIKLNWFRNSFTKCSYHIVLIYTHKLTSASVLSFNSYLSLNYFYLSCIKIKIYTFV